MSPLPLAGDGHRAEGRRVGELSVRRQAGVLRLHLDREAKRNALSAEVLRTLLDAVRGVDPDQPGDRVVLLTSAGPVFCAGADLVEMAPDATGLEVHESRGLLREAVLALRDCPVPVLAAVQGPCLAGGVGLALACDVVLAADAAEFGLPEVDLGLWPFMVSALLGRHTSPKRAIDLMLSGRRVDAAEALQLGLVSRVVPAAELGERAEELAAEIAAKPPVAVRLGKAAFRAVLETPLEPALAAMQAQLSLLATTHDAAEGVGAFLARRPPRWQGR